jgi:hypothetical protein
MRRKSLAALALIPFVAACASASGGGGMAQSPSATVTKPSGPSRNVRAPSRYKPRTPQVQTVPGIQGVIGSTSAELARQFGPARLDVWEGDARKLQFSGNACVLDVYLYPAEPGRDPQATYMDARNPNDGADVDRAACVNALRQGAGTSKP